MIHMNECTCSYIPMHAQDDSGLGDPDYLCHLDNFLWVIWVNGSSKNIWIIHTCNTL